MYIGNAFMASQLQVRRNRLFAFEKLPPAPEPIAPREQREKVKGEIVKQRWRLEDSIWAGRPTQCDSADFYDNLRQDLRVECAKANAKAGDQSGELDKVRLLIWRDIWRDIWREPVSPHLPGTDFGHLSPACFSFWTR